MNRARGSGSLEHELTSLRFAAVAKRLSESARAAGAEVPGFRSPPRAPGVRRSIRRESDGSATVSVALRGRPGIAVVADMIDGVIAAADVTGVDAGLVRDQLWLAVAWLFDEESEETSEPLIRAQAA